MTRKVTNECNYDSYKGLLVSYVVSYYIGTNKACLKVGQTQNLNKRIRDYMSANNYSSCVIHYFIAHDTREQNIKKEDMFRDYFISKGGTLKGNDQILGYRFTKNDLNNLKAFQ